MSHDSRVAALDSLLEDAGLDAVLATKDASIAYLTGFWGLQMERFFGVTVRKGGEGALIAPSLDRDAVAAAPTGLEKALYDAAKGNGLSTLYETFGSAKRIGVEEDHFIWARAKELTSAGYELVPASDLIMELRAAKDAEEIAAVKHACAQIIAVYEEVWADLKVGDSEADVNAKAAYSLARRGGAHPGPHILFGAHAGDPHGSPGSRTLQEGDVIVADIAAQFDGYWGDMTRVAHAGTPSDWAAKAWDIVKEAYDDAVAATMVGNTARDVDHAQRVIVEAHPEIGACLHGAGHAIGTEIHEPPFLVATSETPLREGMIFTVEPGIYNSEKGGIRLEDDILVAADGPVNLSPSALELRVIE
ncbi:Xaa-Pro peptidase family protein [Solirubrobacter phytolaccae]|uniref:Xaa-Pro peptidase family protein n=1 Tax=Solirubrobacter phytolaccae TaxID=1404360 RepID=A0A9X3N469_9ACTN|nr:Xaa-Pro peptidase family protein [Solirubrobacter phytolaccae]MDA0179545.1 Xaa-Pro peptidase family protein [Solirubrobacter phytolaccae]